MRHDVLTLLGRAIADYPRATYILIDGIRLELGRVRSILRATRRLHPRGEITSHHGTRLDCVRICYDRGYYRLWSCSVTRADTVVVDSYTGEIRLKAIARRARSPRKARAIPGVERLPDLEECEVVS